MKTADQLFLDYSCRKLEQLAERICACLGELDPAQTWQRVSENENAVGNLVLHLCGNVRQWIGFGVAGLADTRRRAEEFAARDGAPPAELADLLRGTVREAVAALRALPPGRLLESTRVQGYEVTALEAVYHVVEHFSGHTGQVIFATKRFTGRDLGFYRHLGESRLHSEKVP